MQIVHPFNYEMSILNIGTLLLNVAWRGYLLYMTVGSATHRPDTETGVPHSVTC
jgi:hypothetical protein